VQSEPDDQGMPMSRYTFAEAAEAVLADTRRTMTAEEIWAEIDRRGLVETDGKTPAATLYTELMRKSVNWRADDDNDRPPRFYRRGGGVFGRWIDLTPEQQKAMLAGASAPSPTDTWRELLDRVKNAPSWKARISDLAKERDRSGSEIAALIREYQGGKISLEDLRMAFDQRSREDWVTFAFSGTSFAMQLHMLTKVVTAEPAFEATLRSAIAVPRDEDAARTVLQGLSAALATLRAKGDKQRIPHPNRIPKLFSAFWHVQVPGGWPIYYRSARDALAETNVIAPSDDPIESYLSFRKFYLQLTGELGLTVLELEQLCQVQQEVKDEGDDNEPPPLAPAIERRYWKIAPGEQAEAWPEMERDGVIAISWRRYGLDDLHQYANKTDLDRRFQSLHPDISSRKRRSVVDQLWSFRNDITTGDVVVANRGYSSVVGVGVVTGSYFYRPDHRFPHARPMRWERTNQQTIDDQGPRWRPTIVQLTADAYDALFDEDSIDHQQNSNQVVAQPAMQPYTINDALTQVFLSKEELARILALLEYKKNLVLQGPPGVGKTFVAAELAYILLGAKDETRLKRVQFHQSYAYEDFVRGYRPREGGGFEYRDGPMLEFCRKALADGRPHVMIIDEINRGNLSKILGELMLLLEPDKREERWALELAYTRPGERPFWLPPNLFLIGTMNTADRSLALVDYALRRRFAFAWLVPAFGPGLRASLAGRHAPSEIIDKIFTKVAKLNQVIEQDVRNLGRGYVIGHSYFCQRDPTGAYGAAWYEQIVRFELEPLLEEYFAEDPDKVNDLVAALLS
jgi:hypothetical protein